jgi:hypothetical protein
MAQGALDEPGIHARFKQMGSVRMPQGMDSDAHFGDPGPLFRFAEGPLDTGATHGGGSRRTLGVIPPGGGKEPGGVPMSFPGGAEQHEGLGRQRDVPIFGALAAVDMDLQALTIDVRDLQAEGCMEPQAQALDDGKVDLGVQGGGGREEPADLCHTEDGREAVGGLRAQERQRGPVTLEHVLRKEADAAGAEAHRSRGEAINVFPVQEVVLQFLCRDAVGGLVGELSQQADFADIGLLGTFAFAAELQRGDHVLTQRGHEISPFLH